MAEEERQEYYARRHRAQDLVTGLAALEVNHLHDNYEDKRVVYDRIMAYCNKLMDDLLLIDFEAIEISTYRRPLHELQTSIQECWRKLDVCHTNITKDFRWLRFNMRSTQPQLDELWWSMSVDVQKRLKLMEDHFKKFADLQQELYSLDLKFYNKFKNDPRIVFERYRRS